MIEGRAEVDRRVVILGALGALSALGVAGVLSSCGGTPAEGVTDLKARSNIDWTRAIPGPMPSVDSTGRPFIITLNPPELPPPTVGGGDGLHGNLPDGRSASYVVQNLGSPVRELGAMFRYGPGDERGGPCLATFDSWTPSIRRPVAPHSNCHFAMSPRRWSLGVFRTRTLEVIATRPLNPPAPQDGTPVTARVLRDEKGVTVEPPDGSRVRIEDPRISWLPNESFACWEFAKGDVGAADVTFLRTWAS